MSDETTQNINGNRSFEERIFARFDAIDARLDNLDSRLQKLEQKSYDTKPIWERALAEIVEVKTEMVEVKERLTSLERLSDQIVRKIDVLGKDMLTLRATRRALKIAWKGLNSSLRSNGFHARD